jgi:hypothetical protein
MSEIERRVGDNSDSVPLVEQIAGELAEERKRTDELLIQAAAARLESAVDAGMVGDLILMLRSLERALEDKRDSRKQPYQLEISMIDSSFGALIAPLSRARTGPGSLTEKLDAWQKEHPNEAPATAIAAISSRRRGTFNIDDLKATVAWLVENHPHAMLQAARSIIGPLVRQAGVDRAATTEIPGVRVEIEHRVAVR